MEFCFPSRLCFSALVWLVFLRLRRRRYFSKLYLEQQTSFQIGHRPAVQFFNWPSARNSNSAWAPAHAKKCQKGARSKRQRSQHAFPGECLLYGM